jgi:SAM-dependent methyltransferase
MKRVSRLKEIAHRLKLEVQRTRRDPSRLKYLFDPDRILSLLGRLVKKSDDTLGAPWRSTGDDRFRTRYYGTYRDYVKHQRAKLRTLTIWLPDYDSRYRVVLKERLQGDPVPWGGKSVLCLGARIGTEVKAFHDLGCFAVGIDLNPGRRNHYVLIGDFHHIQFPAQSVDVVFSNCLDHALLVDKLLEEIDRVLKPGGFLVLESAHGLSEGGAPGHYESFWWSSVADLIELFEGRRYSLTARSSFDYPWPGEHVFLKRLQIDERRIPTRVTRGKRA